MALLYGDILIAKHNYSPEDLTCVKVKVKKDKSNKHSDKNRSKKGRSGR